MRPGVAKARQTHRLECGIGAAAPLLAWERIGFQTERDVVAHRAPGQQSIFLEQIAEPAVAVKLGSGLAGQRDLTLAGRLQARDQVEQRAFPAARRAEQRHDLARGHVEGDVAQHFERAEVLGQARDAQGGSEAGLRHRQLPGPVTGMAAPVSARLA